MIHSSKETDANNSLSPKHTIQLYDIYYIATVDAPKLSLENIYSGTPV